jgi:hypothetical protein
MSSSTRWTDDFLKNNVSNPTDISGHKTKTYLLLLFAVAGLPLPLADRVEGPIF